MPEEFPDQSTYDETEFQVEYGSLVENQQDIIDEIERSAGL
jgi:putative spermidine/putrescine transport system substrate-binding protein